jgi:hypothetical protein
LPTLPPCRAVRGLKSAEPLADMSQSAAAATVDTDSEPEDSEGGAVAARQLLRWGHRKAYARAHSLYRSVCWQEHLVTKVWQ